MAKRLITQADVAAAAQAGTKTLPAPLGECIVTPGAWDEAEARGITIDQQESCGQDASAGGEACPAPLAVDDSVTRQVCTIMKSRLGADCAEGDLEKLVREVVAARLGGAAEPPAAGAAQAAGVRHISGERLLSEGAGPVPVAEKVLVADAIECGEDYRLSAGFMQWEKASFRRTLETPEVAVVVEGELQLTVGGRTMVGKAGDMLFFPKGSKVIYSAPGRVKLACVNCLL